MLARHPVASRSLALAALAALLAAPAPAEVFVVDDDGGPGVDFTDLPAALAAAHPGDVLLVQPGGYSAFVLDEGVAILAPLGGVQVAQGTFVAGVPAGQVASLVGLSFPDLRLSGCSGVVVLDGVAVLGDGAVPQALSVMTCLDVRARDLLSAFVALGPPPPAGNQPSGHALAAIGARVEPVDTRLLGRYGFNGFSTQDGGAGGHGALVSSGARVHAVLSELAGGKGGSGSSLCFPTGTFGGTGGDGAHVQSASTLLAMGEPARSRLAAGPGGCCCFGGVPGHALDLSGGSLGRHSGQTIFGGIDVDPGSTLENPSPPDPYLELFRTPTVGAQIRFNVFGEAGDQVTLYLGRSAVVQPLPGVVVEKLTSVERSFPLGAVPPGGVATLAFKLPPHLGPGFPFFSQARVLRGGQELRTNSIAVVVR